MNQKYGSDTIFQYYQDLDKNLGWLNQKTDRKKVIKKASLFPHTK